MDNVLNQTINRRTLLKSAAALGASSLLPAFRAGCGGGSGDATGGGTGAGAPPVGGELGAAPQNLRETHDLNFDLSSAAVSAPYLHLPNSKSHKQPLMPHTPDTRALQRKKYPLLANIPDEKMTHYIGGVDLPGNALQVGAVWGTHPTTKQPVAVSDFLHVPQASMQTLAQTRVKRGQSAQSVSAKLSAYGVGATASLSDASAPVQVPITFNSPPWDVAVALVFQHPSIMNLNADQGADIIDRINTLPGDANTVPYIAALANRIALMIGAGGFPSTTNTGSWAVLVPYKDFQTGQQVYDSDGSIIYTYQMNDALRDTVAAVVRQILTNITNDTAFQGTNWRLLDDTVNSAPAQAAAPAAVSGALKDSSPFQISSDFSIGKIVTGLKIQGLKSDSDRDVSLQVRNYYLRTMSVYVEFLDAGGNTLPNGNKTGIDTDWAKFVGAVMADNQIMGVPMLDDWDNPAVALSFTMPGGASTAKLHFGSLGLGGGDPFTGMSQMGALSTLFLNMVLPTIFLSYGIAVTFQKSLSTTFSEAWKAAVNDPKLLDMIINSLVTSGGADAVQTAAGTLSVAPFVVQMEKLALGLFSRLLPLLSEVAPQLINIFTTSTIVSQAAENIPVAGKVLWVLSSLGDIAAIGESLVEVLTSPSMKTYTLTLTMPSTVVINRDPLDFQFPATATRYVVSANYGGGSTPLVVNGTVSSGRKDPISVPLVRTLEDGTTANPISGGQVTVSVSFYDDSDTLVGLGTTGPVDNLPGSDGTVSIPVTIKEFLVPLSAQTTYQHQSKLVWQGGTHAWSKTAPPPALTHMNLCQGNDGAVCGLHGITVNTATGMAGSSYDAGGQNVIRNLFLGDDPDSGQQFASGATATPMGMAYAPVTSPANGHAFFLQPGADGLYHLRSVDLRPGMSFNMKQATSWGRFHTALDSLTVTDNGTVVGVNRQTHKMEVLGLPASPRDTDNNSDSANTNFAVLAAGKGTRAGMLDTPVATASYGNVVLILEQGNKRVQAFDTDGNTVSIFKNANGKATPLMPLKAESTSVQYLDIAVEGLGYMYVLSYANDGTTPSAYRLDLYSPTGQFLSRTTGVAAGNIAVDLFRNVYSLNYETVAGAPSVEPSISQWLPRNATSSSPASMFSRVSAKAQQTLSRLLPGKS